MEITDGRITITGTLDLPIIELRITRLEPEPVAKWEERPPDKAEHLTLEEKNEGRIG